MLDTTLFRYFKRNWTGFCQPPATCSHVPVALPCRIINISCVCSHRPYRRHNKPGWKCKRGNETFRLHVSRGDESFSKAAWLLTWMRQRRRWGSEATAPQVVPKTKGFPWLKTQLQSLFLALISQVWWKFAAEAFIRVRGEGESDWMGRAEKKRASRGANAESARSAPLFMQHNRSPVYFKDFWESPIMFFCVGNWFSSFEKEVQASCLTWFRGLSSFKWVEASNSISSNSFSIISLICSLCN